MSLIYMFVGASSNWPVRSHVYCKKRSEFQTQNMSMGNSNIYNYMYLLLCIRVETEDKDFIKLEKDSHEKS